MRPAARLQTAIECYTALETAREPADLWLKRYFAERRFIGSKDRRNISELLYTLLRYRPVIAWHLEQSGHPTSPRTLVLATSLLTHSQSFAELLEGCDGTRHVPQPLSRDEQSALQRLAANDLLPGHLPAPLRYAVPDWCFSRLKGRINEESDWDVMLNQPGFTDIRVNLLKTDRDSVLNQLKNQTIEALPCPHAPTGIRLRQRIDIAGLDLYKQGWVEIQEESSQLAGWLVGAEPGETVIDWCAGAGGKSLAMAATMHNRGLLIAADQDAGRLARLPERASRAGADIIVAQPHGQGHRLPMADRVVVDAPCSGSGTWRRNPWRKWQCTPEEVHRYAQLQEEILTLASRYVQPGGRLFYFTCSLFPEENEEQAARFLQNNSNYSLEPAQKMLNQRGIKTIRVEENMLQLLPQNFQTDGFFIASFVKNR